MNVGVRFLRRVLKVRDTTTMRTSCDTFRRLLMTSAGKSTETRLTNSWPRKRNGSAPGPGWISCSRCFCAKHSRMFCRQIHLTRRFSHSLHTRQRCAYSLHDVSLCIRASLHVHAIHDELSNVCSSFPRSDSLSVCPSFTLLLSYHFYLYFDLNSFHVNNAKAIITCDSAN